MSVKLFVDTANLADIKNALEMGFVDGITTNPSIIAKEEQCNFEEHIGNIVRLIREYERPLHLSVEVFAKDISGIGSQAHEFVSKFRSNLVDLSVKIPVGPEELKVIRALAEQKISVNCTACMTVVQAVAAAKAGARYVSLFWGRIRDGGNDEKFSAERVELLRTQALDASDFDPASVVRKTRALLDGTAAEVIVGSIRSVVDVREAMLAGAHIVTVGPKFFKPMLEHYKTAEVIGQFSRDFDTWLKK